MELLVDENMKTVNSLFMGNEDKLNGFMEVVQGIFINFNPKNIEKPRVEDYRYAAKQFVNLLMESDIIEKNVSNIDCEFMSNVVYSAFMISDCIDWNPDRGTISFKNREEMLIEIGQKYNYMKVSMEIIRTLAFMACNEKEKNFAEQDKINQLHLQKYVIEILEALDIDPMYIADHTAIGDFRPAKLTTDTQIENWYKEVSDKIGVTVTRESNAVGDNLLWKLADKMYKKNLK